MHCKINIIIVDRMPSSELYEMFHCPPQSIIYEYLEIYIVLIVGVR